MAWHHPHPRPPVQAALAQIMGHAQSWRAPYGCGVRVSPAPDWGLVSVVLRVRGPGPADPPLIAVAPIPARPGGWPAAEVWALLDLTYLSLAAQYAKGYGGCAWGRELDIGPVEFRVGNGE